MKVDVVIPAFNSALWLGGAIQSVIDQSVPATRIIVVDDGSADDTEFVFGRFKDKISVIHHEANRGSPAARNSGILAGNSELVAFLDADDVWTVDKLEKQLREFEGTDPPGLSYTSLTDCDMQLRPLGKPRRFRRRICERVFSELFLDAFPIPPSTVIVRREVLNLCGLFDGSMLKAQDYECWLRIAMRFCVSCLPEVLCLRRINPASITATSGFEKHAYYAFKAFDLCTKAASDAGISLPISNAERKVLFLRREYRESILWLNAEGETFYKDRLLGIGAYSMRERLISVLLRFRAGLSRLRSCLARYFLDAESST